MAAAAPAPPEAAGDTAPEGLRGLFSAGIEALRTRLDLAAVELEIMLRTLLSVLVWAVGAICCLLLALFFGVTAVILSLWDTHRMLGLLGGSLVFITLAGLFGWLAARALRRQPGMLEGTLGQLKGERPHGGGAH